MSKIIYVQGTHNQRGNEARTLTERGHFPYPAKTHIIYRILYIHYF